MLRRITQTIALVVCLGFGVSANAMLIGSGLLPDNIFNVPSGTTSTTGTLYIADFPTQVFEAEFTATLSASPIGTTFSYNTGSDLIKLSHLRSNTHI